MYENAFNNIKRDLSAEEGIAKVPSFVEKTYWVPFLKHFHDLETTRTDCAELNGEDYTPIIEYEFRWEKCPVPITQSGFDHISERTADDNNGLR